MLPEEILFEEIIMQSDNPDFMSICKSNKNFVKLCSNDLFWKKMYEKYYLDSGMKVILPNATYLELFKICFNLTFIQKTFANPISIAQLYNSSDLNIYGGVNYSRMMKSLIYMHKLTKITFYVNDVTKPFNLSNELNQLPLLKEISYKKKD
jgi:hypothetical protein